MSTGKKKSTFITQDSVPDDHYLDTFGGGVNRKIPKPKFFKQIRDEAQTFIYPTVVSLQQANLEADPDNPIYVRVAENNFYLYTITSLAPGPNDISLDNGATATFQQERIPDADEIPYSGDIPESNVKTALDYVSGEIDERVISLSDITSLASLDASALLDGQQFRRKEFWSDTGVGGVDLYWNADESVANHNGGTIIDPAKISELDTGAKTFGTYFDADTVSGNTGCFVADTEVPSVYIFGAVETGSFVTEAVQAAIDSTTGELFMGANGDSFQVSRLSGRSNLNMTGSCTLDFSHNADYADDVLDPLWFISGSAGANRFTTQDVSQGDTSIFVDDNSGITAGDVIEIATPGQNGGFVEPTPATTNGECVLVEGTSGSNEVLLAEPITDEFGYSVSDGARVRLIDSARNITIGSGVTVNGKGRPSSGQGDIGLVIWYGRDVKIHCSFTSVDRMSLRMDSCYNYEVSGASIIHDPKGSNESPSYGVCPSSSSSHGKVFNCYFVNQRHGLITSKLSTALDVDVWGVVRHLDVYENMVVNTWESGLGTHNDVDQISFRNNTLIGCSRGVEVRERNAIVEGNEFYFCGQDIILYQCAKNVTVQGNWSYHSQGNLLFTTNSRERGLSNIRILHNYALEPGDNLINISADPTYGMEDIVIDGNEAIRPQTGRGIDVSGDVANDVRIINNTVRSPASHGIAVLSGGQVVMIDDNYVEFSGGDSYRITGTYVDAYAKDNTSVSPSGVHFFGQSDLVDNAGFRSFTAT